MQRTQLRWRRATVGLAALLLSISAAAADDDFVSIQEFRGLRGWRVEHTKADSRGGVLTIRQGPGWVRYEEVLANFVLRFDVQLRPRDEAAVFVRSWPTFDKHSTPNNSYRFALEGRVHAKIGVDGEPEWQRVEIACNGQSLRVHMNGALVHSDESTRNPQGYLALGSLAGQPAFRNIGVKRLIGPRITPPSGIYAVEDGIELPRVIREVRPQYTGAAMRARIQGPVLLAAVVLPDGTVGDVRLVQSLDPVFGLDREAASVARQWRFIPAKRNGQSVPVLVTIELTFTLR